MPKVSAGLLLYRRIGSAPEVLLVHPGGPFWGKKDEGAWSIPKGEIDGDEEPLDVARREFGEELGAPVPEGEVVSLGEIRQSGGKRVLAWAVEGDLDADAIESNTFEMEWPPRSGRTAAFPEVDRAAWFDLADAAVRLNAGQVPFLERLSEAIGPGTP